MFKSVLYIDFIGFYFDFPYFTVIPDFFSQFCSISLIKASILWRKTAISVKNVYFYITKIIMIQNVI